MLSGNLATNPNMALRPLVVIRSNTGARPVRKEASELRKKIMPPDSKDPSLTIHVKGFDGYHVTDTRHGEVNAEGPVLVG